MKLSWLIGSRSSKRKISKPLLYMLYAGATLSVGLAVTDRFLSDGDSSIDSTPWTVTEVVSGDRLNVARHEQTQELKLCGVSSLGIQTQEFLQTVIEQGDGTVIWSDAGNRHEAWIALESGYDVNLLGQYSDKIASLDRIRNILIDIGKLDEAKLLAQILCNRSEIEFPLRRKLENFLDTELVTWRQTVEIFIKRQQPFKLVYQDASDRLFQFTILHARVEPIEKREYLHCLCEETEGNTDIEELRQNWSLRLDRIKQAEVIKLDRQWQKNLQQIEVELQFFGGLAYGYKQKAEDIYFGNVEGEPPFRKVMRKVESTFWFFRDIVRYGGQCEIVSPENIRAKFIDEVVSGLNQVYEN